MYYVITDQKIVKGKTLAGLNSSLGTLLEENEFKIIGNDKIINLSKNDLLFLQDKKRLSQIPIQKLYRKDNSIYLIYALFALQVITLIRI